MRGTGRRRRLDLLDALEADDPALAEALEALRGRDPQAYRKRLRELGRARGLDVRIDGTHAIPEPTPGREADPGLRLDGIGPFFESAPEAAAAAGPSAVERREALAAAQAEKGAAEKARQDARTAEREDEGAPEPRKKGGRKKK